MITKLKEILIPQTSLYGGFIFSLANLMNNDYILSELSSIKNINFTDFLMNKVYHKYTNQRTFQESFIQKQLLLNIYPASITDQKEKNLFMFDKVTSDKEDLFKVYFIHTNLTKFRKHDFIVLKPSNESGRLISIDPLQNNILELNESDLFNNYYINGFSTIENRNFEDHYLNKKDILHLL